MRSATTSPSLRRKLHRNLRGRYALAILIMLLGAGAGGAIGWTAVQPLYRGTGSLYINPVPSSAQGTPETSLLALFESFVASQVEMIGTGKVARRAMATEVWRATGRPDDEDAARAFEEQRSVARVPGTHIVQIAFVDPDPEVARAGVRALIQAYQEQFAELHADDEENDRGTGEQERRLVRNLREGMDRLAALTADFGGVEGLEIRHRAAVRLVMATEDALRSLRRAIHTDPDGGTTRAPLSPTEIAVQSPQMSEYLAHLALQEAEEKTVVRRPGTSVERVIALRGRIDVLKEGIDDLARAWNTEHAAQNPDAPTPAQRQTREQGLVKRLERLQVQSRELGRFRGEARTLQTDNAELNAQLVRIEALERDLAARPMDKGRVQIADPGTRPTAPYVDPRKKVAAIGAGLGALLGLLVIFLTGMRDRRLKDAVGADDVLSGVRSLGLLPSLPTTPGTTEGTRVATHFAHQIRTLLEISHARDEGVCLCITGPVAGSGKTTLAAALGLSFASTGSRTLLVDADGAVHGLSRVVMQMLVAHLEQAGTESEVATDGAAPRGQPAEARHHLLDPLVPEGVLHPAPTPETPAVLLSDVGRRLGLRRARDEGIVADLFSLADLIEAGASRDRLALHLMSELASDGTLASGSPARWIPARIRGLGFPAVDLDASTLEHHLYRTGLENLRFLPLPATGLGRGASVAMTAGALARLRELFDVVLVDAGSVPGTDETSLVAVQADSVVLVVSPEDQGPDAERALAHLEQIRARVAGIVFNRADHKDIVKTGRTMYVSQSERQVG